MILVDTSAWIALFRRRDGPRFQAFALRDDIATCLPVRQEFLQGFDNEVAYNVARRAFRDIPMLEDPLTADTFDLAISLYRNGRRAGLTIRSSVDCLIAACAIRNDASVLHADRDFDKLSQVSALRCESLEV